MSTAAPKQKLERPWIVDEQIERTRRALKLVDLLSGVITLLIGLLVFLLTCALLEHWIIPGGWSSTARIVLFGLLSVAVAWYSWRTFWPLLSRPINPIYAAQTIEQDSPSLKNSLLNLLLLRGRRQQLPPKVFQAIEQQAATRLSQVQADTAVDQSAVLRLARVLVVVVALFAIYLVLSPKDLIDSAGRVLLPWANISAPSRVEFVSIEPGDLSVARGERLTITADVRKLDEDDRVLLHYQTIDDQLDKQRDGKQRDGRRGEHHGKQQIAMLASSPPGEEIVRLECQLPAQNTGGIQQDMYYWIEAGDARSARYRVSVFARPTMVVRRVRYDYPAYTGYRSREFDNMGDLRALEGTKVTLFGLANQPIKQAYVDFEADGRHDVEMKVENPTTGQQATAVFQLELNEDRRTPRFGSYVLRFTTPTGRKNIQPPKFRIDVTPDYGPEIRMILPEEELIDVPIDQEIRVEIEARDPDFALSEAKIIGEIEGQPRLDRPLLSKNHTGRFSGSARLVPRELGLQVGDVLQYWAEARDNRTPEPNIARTPKQRLRVVENDPADRFEDDKSERNKNADQQPSDEGGEDAAGQGDASDQGIEGGQGGSAGNEGEQSAEGDQTGGDESAEKQGGDRGNQSAMNGGGETASDEGDSNQGENEDGGAGENTGENDGDQKSENNAANGSDSANGRNSANNEQFKNQAQEKVSPEGDDDGTAFDRMTEHFAQQDANQNGDARSEQRAASGEKKGNQQQAKQGSSNSEPGEQDQSPEGGNSPRQDQPVEDGQESQVGQEKQADESAGSAEAGERPEGRQSGTETSESPPGDNPPENMSPEQGPAGAGDNQGEEQGSPEAQGRKPSDKTTSQDDRDSAQNDGEPASQGRDSRESDSRGGQGGDRSGGGQEGAGQQADADGKGGAGQNQAADEGAGQAAEAGEGEDSSRSGGDKTADEQTGHSSENQSGAGSKQSEQSAGQQGQSSEQPGGGQPGQPQGGKMENGDQPTGGEQASDSPPNGGSQQAGNQQSPQQRQDNNRPNQNGQGSAAQQPLGGGQGGSDDTPPPTADQGEPGGDEANLEYAKQQTDLVLDRLSDQLEKKKVDRQLLDKLGWSQDELRRFVDRWKHLKDKASGQGADASDAQQQLDAALRSLGLRKNRRMSYQSQQNKDDLRNLRDANRVRTPAEYVELMRAYVKGTAQGGEKSKP